jgi:hypothetical protein
METSCEMVLDVIGGCGAGAPAIKVVCGGSLGEGTHARVAQWQAIMQLSKHDGLVISK